MKKIIDPLLLNIFIVITILFLFGFGAANYWKKSGTNLTPLNSSLGVALTGPMTAPTLNTGQGANELYDMDQNVLTTSAVEFLTSTANQIRTCNSSKPATVVFGRTYCADGDNWNPSGQDWTGYVNKDHLVMQTEPSAAECIAEDNPHDKCTAAATCATCSETWEVIRDVAGVTYVSGIEIQTSTYSSSQELTVLEMSGGVIYVTGAATISLKAIFDGANFSVITFGNVAVSIDPDASDTILRDGNVQDDGDKITNTSTTGDMAVCTYYSADAFFCVTNSWTDGG